jgi:uncharacterized membrane protein YecN with MAPEG domain
MPIITALYAGLLGLMWIAIAFQAGRLRGKTGISVGHGDNMELLVAMRRHANFVESAPLAVILIGTLELCGAPSLGIHLLGGGLVLFRAAHAIGFQADAAQSVARGIGAAGSTLVILVASLWSIWMFVGA